MSVFEFAIAREAWRLIQESKTRELKEREEWLLEMLLPTLRRLELQDRIGWTDAR